MFKRFVSTLLLSSILLSNYSIAFAKEYSTKVELHIEKSNGVLDPDTQIPSNLNRSIGVDVRGNLFYLQDGISISTQSNSGYIKGRGNSIQPLSNLTRAEFCAILNRTIQFRDDKEKRTYSDIQNHWAKNDIEKISSYGLVFGTGTDKFSPNDPITREQVLIILSRLVYTDIYSSKQPVIMNIDNYGYVDVIKLLNSGIYRHYPSATYSPSEYITRGEVIHLINTLVYKEPYDISNKANTLEESAKYSDLFKDKSYLYYSDCVKAIEQ